MNPDISAIIDFYYYTGGGDEEFAHLLEEMAGFGHVHPSGEDDHHHHAHGPEPGFNLRHLELMFSAAVDPYFRATAIAAIEQHGAEIEVAEIETSRLPLGLKLKAGKFYSDFGYLNAKHAHEWDFADQPLIYLLTLGDHGLNDLGVQLSWLAPAPFYLLAGMEAFQGDNERAFAYHGDGPLPEHDGPRGFTGWLKFAPSLPGAHGLLTGLALGAGKHQEEHDGDADGQPDHWLDGDSRFWVAHLVYKYNAPRPYGQGNLTVQGEYFRRRHDLKLVEHHLRPQLVGNRLVKNQAGYYLQALYGFRPRWKLGARWEQLGLTNDVAKPSGARDDLGTSYRATAMLDFTPTEYSHLRVQLDDGRYETEDGRERAWNAYLQFTVSLGAHGAHAF